MAGELQGTMTTQAPNVEMEALLAALAQQVQGAQGQAQQAGQQYEQAAAEPVPQVGGMAAFLPGLLSNTASIISGNQNYAKQGREGLQQANENLLEKRKTNLQSMRDKHATLAEHASKLGNVEASAKWSAQVAKTDRELDKIETLRKEGVAKDELAARHTNELKQIEAQGAESRKTNAGKATEKDKAADLKAIGTLTDNIRQDPDLKDYAVIRDQLSTGEDAVKANNSAGDIILMRAVARATDPRTGVREEEYRTFKGAQGALATIGVGVTKGMVGRGQLTPYGRKALLDRLKSIHARKQVQSNRSVGMFRRQANAYGIDPDLVLRDYSAEAEAQTQVPAPTAPAGGVAKWGRDASGNPVRL